MVSDLAFFLAGRGNEILAITSRQRYDNPRERLARREHAGGVDILRVPTTRFGRAFLPGRAIDYATFYLTAFFALLRHARRGSVVVALTDPPLISVVAALAAKLRGAALVNWTQDLFPEIATALGMRAPRVLAKLRDWSLRAAANNVALSDAMAARIAAAGARAVVQHNWADAALHPIDREATGTFVVAYSGNLGRAHDAATIAGAIRRLAQDARVRFVFIGGGAQLDAVRRAASDNVTFAPYQPRERLSESLSAADAHLVSMQPQLEGLVMPSKFYGVLAAGRPVLFIGAPDGDMARLVREHDCGFVIEAGDDAMLAQRIRELAADRDRAAAMGRRGLHLYRTRFAPEIALASWESILIEAAHG